MILISYATETYRHYQDLLDADCQKYGIPHRRYDDLWFNQTAFYQAHRDIVDQPKWAGYGIWKAYIILDALHTDPLVIYQDATSGIKADPGLFIDSVKYIHTPRTYWINKHFCRRDAFVLMGCDGARYYDAHQIWSGSVIVRSDVRWIIEEWLYWNADRRVADDGENECGLPNLPGFSGSRGDQSVLSILAAKYTQWFDTRVDGLPFYDRTGAHV